MHFEFATASHILFGNGRIQEAGEILSRQGTRVFVLSGVPDRILAPLMESLRKAGIESIIHAVGTEPSVEDILEGRRRMLETDCDLVVGYGGGSAMDSGKAVAALASNTGDPMEYFEVVGKGLPLERPPLFCMAIPTTAGTGAEVTKNAVIRIPEHKVKVSLRSPWILPKVALVDPSLTRTLPPDVTAATGMDALTQVLEPFVCLRANPLTDSICRDGLTRAARWLRIAYEDGANARAREEMSLVSLYGGFALANAGLGAVHGLASPIGGMFAAPHGSVCARLLPWVMRANLKALNDRSSDKFAMERYREMACLFTGDPYAEAEDGIQWIHQLMEDLHIPRLGEYGINGQDVPLIVEKAAAASSMKSNPIMLTRQENTWVVEEAL